MGFWGWIELLLPAPSLQKQDNCRRNHSRWEGGCRQADPTATNRGPTTHWDGSMDSGTGELKSCEEHSQVTRTLATVKVVKFLFILRMVTLFPIVVPQQPIGNHQRRWFQWSSQGEGACPACRLSWHCGSGCPDNAAATWRPRPIVYPEGRGNDQRGTKEARPTTLVIE